MVRSGEPTAAAFLVDLDDTVFDHSLTCRAAIRVLRQEESYLRTRPLDALWAEYRRQLDALSPSPPHRRLTLDRARRERWRRLALSCGRTLSAEEAADLSRRYRVEYQRRRRPVAGARELLRRLHRIAPVVIVTNNEVAEQEEKVRFLGIEPYLDGLVISEAVGASKPDRRIFDVALSAAGATAERAVMLGDSWPSDVEGARRAGIRPVWFNRFGLAPAPRRRVRQLRSLRPAEEAARLLLRAADR